jgi:uncharacterized membrane protein YgdD (TMEM256/DUF423 family)
VKNTKAAFSAFNMAAAILLGALAAHALKGKITAEQLESFKTGVLYHLVQSLALLALALNNTTASFNQLFWLIATGMLLFSFSIYLLAIKDLAAIAFLAPVLGPITPIGGVLMIAGWLLIGIQFIRSSRN